MRYPEAQKRLVEFRKQIAAVRAEMRKVVASMEPEEVQDYVFGTVEGPRRLSDLFGDHDHLLMIHNMGSSCPYCTLWADGYNGIYDHLTDRAALVVSTPDPPQKQQQFARSRGWKFPLVSHVGTSFAQDMGYRCASGGWLPGLSAFERRGSRIVRVSDATSNPGDDFCVLWHVLDMLPGGAGDWQPQFGYAGAARRAGAVTRTSSR